MHRKQVWQYSCDFCRKKSCSASHMSRHEKSCTGNPDRKCRMCEFTGLRQASIRELLVAIDADVQDTETDGLGLLSVTEFPSLESVANGCPACMLCAVRIAETVNDLAVGFMLDYKYRQAEFWKAFRIKNQLSEIY